MYKLLGQVVLVGNLDEAALLGMRCSFVALVIPRILERIAGRQDFACVFVDKHRTDAEFVAGGWRLLGREKRKIHKSFMVADRISRIRSLRFHGELSTTRGNAMVKKIVQRRVWS